MMAGGWEGSEPEVSRTSWAIGAEATTEASAMVRSLANMCRCFTAATRGCRTFGWLDHDQANPAAGTLDHEIAPCRRLERQDQCCRRYGRNHARGVAGCRRRRHQHDSQAIADG